MKSCALTDLCKCNECKRKFECFTQEPVFTDPMMQGLFEAYIAQGNDRERSILMVAETLMSRLPQTLDVQDFGDAPPTWDDPVISITNSSSEGFWYDSVKNKLRSLDDSTSQGKGTR